MPDEAGQIQYDFCPKCGVPNALTSNLCAGCGAELDRSASAPVYTATPAPITAAQDLVPGDHSIDLLRQSVAGDQSLSGLNEWANLPESSVPQDSDQAQGFDFCSQCHAPNELNRAVCAGCGASLNREALEPLAQPVPPSVPELNDSAPPARSLKDLRPPRPAAEQPVAGVPLPAVPNQSAATGSAAAAGGAHYDFCKCGVPNALTATVCAGCGTPLDRSTGPGTPVTSEAAVPRPPRGGNVDVTRRLIEQSAQRLNAGGPPSGPAVSPPPSTSAAAPTYDFCLKCGVPNALTAFVCSGCGASLDHSSIAVVPPPVATAKAAPAQRASAPTDSGGNVVFCAHCGVPNATTDRVCAGCGQDVAKSTVLPSSGSSGNIACPRCGSVNGPGTPTCSVCGASLKPAFRSAAAQFGLTAKPLTAQKSAAAKTAGTNDAQAPDDNFVTVGPLPLKRNPLTMFFLSLVSVDMYRPYWLYTATREIDGFLVEDGPPSSWTIVAFFVTFSLYDLYWDYVYAKKIARMMELVNLTPVDNSILFLFLNITLVGKFAVPALMQINLNEVRAAVEWAYPQEDLAF